MPDALSVTVLPDSTIPQRHGEQFATRNERGGAAFRVQYGLAQVVDRISEMPVSLRLWAREVDVNLAADI